MEQSLTIRDVRCHGSACLLQASLPRVFRLLAKTGVYGRIMVVGCNSSCGFRAQQTEGLLFLPEREFDGTNTALDGLWIAAHGDRWPERLAVLVERVKPGGAVVIFAASTPADVFRVQSPALNKVQFVCRRPGLLLGLRRLDLYEPQLARLTALYAPRGWRRVLKRTIDVVLASVALVLAIPVILIITTLIRLTSPGPSLMRQVRVKQGGRLFTFYKFRTMPIDAKLRYSTAYAYEYSEQELAGIPFKQPNDTRNTRLGQRIRRVSLDELPNLISCIRGDISLVGPRPELPELIRYYGEQEQAILSVKPGITGLAQVSGRDRLSVRDQQRIDLSYVQRCSLRLDLQILLRTICRVFHDEDAY